MFKGARAPRPNTPPGNADVRRTDRSGLAGPARAGSALCLTALGDPADEEHRVRAKVRYRGAVHAQGSTGRGTARDSAPTLRAPSGGNPSTPSRPEARARALTLSDRRSPTTLEELYAHH